MMSTRPSQRPESDPGALLRARGLRVTPQRRAILGAFSGADTEHLSADEVHARACVTVPEISRGTVYAALAELTELGLLAAIGSPEPVRYESNATEHQHFRCRLCLRLFDIDLPASRTNGLVTLGFQAERSVTTVEGVCADCVEFRSGLEAGADRTASAEPSSAGLPEALACSVIESPIGPVLLAATADGLVRGVYDDHFEAPALRALIGRRRGGQAARNHLAAATAYIDVYFTGRSPPRPSCQIDWESLHSVSVATLQATCTIPFGGDRSYDALGDAAPARGRGMALGTNPLAILVPCHRVTRGREITEAYVGGTQRKRWLREHELATTPPQDGTARR